MTTHVRNIALPCFAALLSPCAIGQSASLALFRGTALTCPVSGSNVSLVLVNTSTNRQTIPAGTTLTLVYSAPVLQRPTVTASTTVSVSGNTVTVVFPQDAPLPVQTSLGLLNAQLNLAGLADGTPIGVTITVAPANALTITGQDTGTVLAMVDLPSCTTPPTPPAVVADDLGASCLSAEEIAVIDADLKITVEGDPTAGTLVCRAADGSADLTRLEERAYQTLRVMHEMSFDAPLPWTTKSLYDWLVGSITAIRHRTDVTQSFCCLPANTINIASSHSGTLDFYTSEWLGTMGVLYSHEARHNQGFLHTCGPYDQTLNEMGAWAVQYYLQEWMTRHSDSFLTPRNQTLLNFRDWFWQGAQSMINDNICDLSPGVVASPKSLDFGTQPVSVASLPRIAAITLTKGVGTAMSRVTVTGANASDFTVVRENCTGATVLPSCVVTLSFTPGASGQRNATLAINYGAGLSQSAALTGTGGSACTYLLGVSGRLQPREGGSGSVTVSSSAGCVWTAVSKSSWLAVNSASGAGSGVVNFTVAANPKDGARQGVLAIAGQTVAVAQAGIPIPQFHETGVVSAASLVEGGAPGSIVTIFGAGLTRNLSGIVTASRTPIPTQLSGTSVELVSYDSKLGTYTHLFAPVFALANIGGLEQINLQIPWEIPGNVVEIVVHNNGLLSGLLNFSLRPALPGIFTVDGTAGVIVHGADNSLIASDSPAARGEVVVLYATGLGAVSPPSITGQPAANAEPLSRTVSTPVVTIGGAGAQVLFSGLAPNFVGLYQMNVVVPQNSKVGNVPVIVQAGGVASKAVTMSVQ